MRGETVGLKVGLSSGQLPRLSCGRRSHGVHAKTQVRPGDADLRGVECSRGPLWWWEPADRPDSGNDRHREVIAPICGGALSHGEELAAVAIRIRMRQHIARVGENMARSIRRIVEILEDVTAVVGPSEIVHAPEGIIHAGSAFHAGVPNTWSHATLWGSDFRSVYPT